MAHYKGTKGKNNKFNIGNRVGINKRVVNLYVKNLIGWFYVGGLNGERTEIPEEHYAEFATWLHFHLKKATPVGKVIGYGAEDHNPKTGHQLKDKTCVLVQVKTPYGDITHFFSERDLILHGK